MNIELRRAKRGLARRNQFYFRIVADNGKVLAHSEGHANRGDLEATVENIRRTAGDAVVVDLT